MLQTPLHSPPTGNPANWQSHDPEDSDFVDLEQLLGAARRQWRLVVLLAMCGVLLGVGYILTAVPIYTATTNIIIDKNQSKIVDELAAFTGRLDDAAMLSEVELLKSEKIAERIVDKLDLTNDDTFLAGTTSIVGRLKSSVLLLLNVSDWFSEPLMTADQANEERLKAIGTLQENLNVGRVGRTYVLTVSYKSPDPNQAARIARAYAEAYLTDQLDSKFEATRRASTWLQARIQELKQQSLDTDLAVQKFRAEHGLVSSGGKLLTEQQLSEVSSQLIIAQAETAQAKAKLERIQQIVKSGDTKALVNDALVSSVINTMREKYLDASKREAEISAKLTTNHIQAVNLRNEMREYERLMFEELQRIAQSYESAYKVALSRQKSLEDNLASMMGVNAQANETQVTLRELERESETYKNLYQTFLQRYQEALQQQSFPVTEARVITQATPPDKPSHPRKALVLVLSAILGAGVGAGLGAFREFRERFFRTGDQVRDELGLEFLGLMPIVKHSRIRFKGRKIRQASPQSIQFTDTASNYTLEHPLSSFSEALRGAKIAADISLTDKKPKVIGIVSCLPSEGKSTVASNLALLIGAQGGTSLLIDGDMRNPGLTRSIAPHAEVGLVETIMGEYAVEDVLLYDQNRSVAVLPAVVKHRLSHTSELLASPGMERILKTTGEAFDYVIVDLPPLTPVVDVKAFASRVDGFVFVVEWGKTTRHLVRSTLASHPMVRDKCLGVLLNKSDSKQMKYYRSYGSSEYYYSRYSSYYRDEK